MHPTLTLGQLRVEMLDFADALVVLRQRLLDMAAQHAETCVPSYTNGVQAMPIGCGQHLLDYTWSWTATQSVNATRSLEKLAADGTTLMALAFAQLLTR